MYDFLTRIVEIKKRELVKLKKLVTENSIRESALKNTAKVKFKNVFSAKTVHPLIIAEIKLASPTIKFLGSKKDILKRAVQYEKAGADVISVITEKHFFKGDVNFISKVRKKVKLPILQKDFVIDSYQIYQAKLAGADAMLFIARIIDVKRLKEFVNLAKEIGIEPVVEVNDVLDLKKAVLTKTTFIAVNARDLRTFEIDKDKACELMKKIPKHFIKLGFSGVNGLEDVEKYLRVGAVGVLVGTSLMRAKNVTSYIKDLKAIIASPEPRLLKAGGVGEGRLKLPSLNSKKAELLVNLRKPRTLSPRKFISVKVKICGIRSKKSALAVINSGADYLGFNFVAKSKRYIDPTLAKKIIKLVKGRAKIVGVFQDETAENINELVSLLDLDFVQIHRGLDEEFVKKIKSKVIQAIPLPSKAGVNKLVKRMENYQVSYFMIDREKQGQGKIVDAEKALFISEKFPIFFAGGLTPGNVSEIVNKVKPFAVDVASGIETNGIEDINKIEEFISNAKGVSI